MNIEFRRATQFPLKEFGTAATRGFEAYFVPIRLDAPTLFKMVRLIRLERRLDAEVATELVNAAKGQTLAQISKTMHEAIDQDEIQARAKQDKGEYHEPTEKEIREVRETRIKVALAPARR